MSGIAVVSLVLTRRLKPEAVLYCFGMLVLVEVVVMFFMATAYCIPLSHIPTREMLIRGVMF